MRVVQCPNKHYYDADKYVTCPHCDPLKDSRQMQSNPTGQTPEQNQKPENRTGFFGRKQDPRNVQTINEDNNRLNYGGNINFRQPDGDVYPAARQNQSQQSSKQPTTLSDFREKHPVSQSTQMNSRAYVTQRTITDANELSEEFGASFVTENFAEEKKEEKKQTGFYEKPCTSTLDGGDDNFDFGQSFDDVVTKQNDGGDASADAVVTADGNWQGFASAEEEKEETRTEDRSDDIIPETPALNEESVIENAAEESEPEEEIRTEDNSEEDIPEIFAQTEDVHTENDPEETRKEPAEPAENSLRKQVEDAINAEDSKTVGFFRMAGENGDNSNPDTDPVVGWLVCVGGKHFGESFVITAGQNSIGRNLANDICLSKDNSVSREKHAWITYNPRKREFRVKPGESKGLIFLNDDMVDESVVIGSKDILEIGDGKYLLAPLCGPDFTWEQYMN